MSKGKDKDIFSDADSFWDLEMLLPPGEKRVYMPSHSDTSVTDLRSDLGSVPENTEKIPTRQSLSPKEREYTAVRSYGAVSGTVRFEEWLKERQEIERARVLSGKQTVIQYVPDNPLIRKVTISADKNPGRNGGRFLSDAEHIYPVNGKFEGNVPFDSYYPQYSQMTREQMDCYIGFRTLVRSGSYPQVDQAYIYLYIYELINLTSRMTPDERATALCGLINGYPDCDTRLFSDMCNWLCDICLIYNVVLPEGVFGENISRVIDCANLKEFFIRTEKDVDSGIAFVLSSGRYDYRKSRFYHDYRSYYDKLIDTTVCAVLKDISESDSRYAGADAELCTLTHESYFGALCTAAVKRTVSVECVCVTRSETVRRTVTDLVKYTENCLRGFLGIKPRLTVGVLTLDRKELVKRHFREISDGIALPAKETKKFKKNASLPEVPDYERLYEPVSNGVSFEEAERIEKLSWRITEKLVSGQNEDVASVPTEEILNKTNYSDPAVSDVKKERYTAVDKLSGDSLYREALRLLTAEGDEAFCSFAQKNGYIPDALADEINDRLYGLVYDVVIITGDGHSVVTDYADEIGKFISGEYTADI